MTCVCQGQRQGSNSFVLSTVLGRWSPPFFLFHHKSLLHNLVEHCLPLPCRLGLNGISLTSSFSASHSRTSTLKIRRKRRFIMRKRRWGRFVAKGDQPGACWISVVFSALVFFFFFCLCFVLCFCFIFSSLFFSFFSPLFFFLLLFLLVDFSLSPFFSVAHT